MKKTIPEPVAASEPDKVSKADKVEMKKSFIQEKQHDEIAMPSSKPTLSSQTTETKNREVSLKVLETEPRTETIAKETSNSQSMSIEYAEESKTQDTNKKVIKRKRVDEDEDTGEFISLSLGDAFSGQGLSVLHAKDWNTRNVDTLLQLSLNNFGLSPGMNSVLAMRLTVPVQSPRWSFNICPTTHQHNQNIFLHFNPRYRKKNEFILNDKPGTWGGPKRVGVRNLTIPTGVEILLVVVIRPEAFYFFIEPNKLFTSFTHRRDISRDK